MYTGIFLLENSQNKTVRCSTGSCSIEKKNKRAKMHTKHIGKHTKLATSKSGKSRRREGDFRRAIFMNPEKQGNVAAK